MRFLIGGQGDALCLRSDARAPFFKQEKQSLPLGLHPARMPWDISGRSWRFGVRRRPPWETDQEKGESLTLPWHQTAWAAPLQVLLLWGRCQKRRGKIVAIRVSLYTQKEGKEKTFLLV